MSSSTPRGDGGRFTGVWLWIGVLIATVALAAAVVFGDKLIERVSIEMWAASSTAAIILIAILALGRVLTEDWRSTGFIGSGFGSLVVALATLATISLPGIQLITGARESKLLRLDVLLTANPTPNKLAFVLAALTVGVFYIAELVVSAGVREHAPGRRQLATFTDSKWTFWILIGIGLVATGISPPDRAELLARGAATGEGAKALAAHALFVGVGLGVFRKHWGSKLLVGVSALSVVVLVAQGTRSPLMFIAIAAFVRFIKQSSEFKNPLPRIGLALCVAYVALVVMVSLSAWRAEIRDGVSHSFSDTVQRTAQDPFSRLSAAGLDTFDGLVLSQHVDRHAAGGSLLDPLMSAGGFIPHQVWTDKPEWLSVKVTHSYTHFPGASGLFLSGPGYGYILYGGVIGSLICYLLLGAMSGFVFRRVGAESFYFVIFSYFFFQFVLIGDSYPAFYCLGLALVYALARWGARVLIAGTRSTTPESRVGDAPNFPTATRQAARGAWRW